LVGVVGADASLASLSLATLRDKAEEEQAEGGSNALEMLHPETSRVR
jgi:hypothetical protein